jgi:hypothetical protein
MIHKSMEILRSTTDIALLQATSGVIKNLTIPEDAKRLLTVRDAWSVVQSAMKSNDEKFLELSLRILRSLMGNFENLSDLAETWKTIGNEFSIILTGHADNKATDSIDQLTYERIPVDMENREIYEKPTIKKITAELVVALYRAFWTLPGLKNETLKHFMESLDESQTISNALLFHTMYPDPAMKMGGWMGLAIKARTREGASSIYEVLYAKEYPLSKLLKETAEGAANVTETEYLLLIQRREYSNQIFFASSMLEYLVS